MTDRVSVPTPDIARWIAAGWAVVHPDFDRANHTLLRWAGTGEPREPCTVAQ
jgi:hypothetical protein